MRCLRNSWRSNVSRLLRAQRLRVWMCTGMLDCGSVARGEGRNDRDLVPAAMRGKALLCRLSILHLGVRVPGRRLAVITAPLKW